ncbi:hypothetical protein ACWDKQ_02365 [Saccharopolyspora sp. NPDC000995]
MSRRNLFAAALSAAVVTTTLAALPAAAAPNLNDFVLNNTSGDLHSRVDKLDAQLPKLGVQNILDQANRQGSNTLLTGEYCADQGDSNLNGRVARWDLDAVACPAKR